MPVRKTGQQQASESQGPVAGQEGSPRQRSRATRGVDAGPVPVDDAVTATAEPPAPPAEQSGPAEVAQPREIAEQAEGGQVARAPEGPTRQHGYQLGMCEVWPD